MSQFVDYALSVLNEVNVLNNPLNGDNTQTQGNQTQNKVKPGITPSNAQQANKPNPILSVLQQIETSGLATAQDILNHPQLGQLIKRNPQQALITLQRFAQQKAAVIAQNARKIATIK